MNLRTFSVVLRWIVGLTLGFFAIRALTGAAGHNVGNDSAAVGSSVGGTLYGLAGLIAAVALLAPELVVWITVPVQRAFDNLMMPQDSGGPPPADYKLARFYLHKERYEEAYDEYTKIIRYHPDQLDAYLEGMETARRWGRADLLNKIYKRGKGRARAEEARQLLEAARTQPVEIPLEIAPEQEGFA